MRTLIVANGEIGSGVQNLTKVARFELIIAVDGGYRHCETIGLLPDIVIGDHDSLSTDAIQQLQATGITLVPYPPEKDEIDLELALLHAVEAGAKEIVVLGGLGGRVDMSLANLALLAHPRFKHVSIEFWHNEQRIWLIQPPGGEIRGAAGDTLSLIPFMGEAKGIQTTNLAYPLQNEDLPFGPARGISNVLEAELAHVSLNQGALLAIWTKGRA